MKNVLILLFLVFCGLASGQIINFPDVNFKNALVNSKCVDLDGNGTGDADADLNNDGEIDVNEALNITGLTIQNKYISNLNINEFLNLKTLICSYNKLSSIDNLQLLTNLEILHCNNNQLTSIDVQGLTNLKDLKCNSNKLTSLNVQGLSNLTSLYCNGNQLTYLNVQGLKNLPALFCYGNRLTTLDVRELTNLRNLSCYANNLSSLNVQGLTNLRDLLCYSNNLTSLNVQGLTNLKDLSCYSNKLTSLNVQGLTNLIGLYCYKNQITSLDVQGLTNLKILYCNDNQMTNLNVQGLTNLSVLDCYNNGLTTFNFDGLTNLGELDCSNNRITSFDVKIFPRMAILKCSNNQMTFLDLKGLTNLSIVYCYENQLTFIDVRDSKYLYALDCYSNQLTSLDLNGLKYLEKLNCYDNKLISLNVQGLTNLNRLYCYENLLTSIDVQGLPILTDFRCNNNQLSSIYMKGTKVSGYTWFQNNPNLKYICCNEDIINVIKNKSISYGQNCEVNSYCSFTPSGKLYVTQGNNTYDENQNGCDDQDRKIPNFKYNITEGSITGRIISNSTGRFSIPLQAGTHTITPILEYPNHFEIAPTSYTISFPSTSDTITQDFCITPKGVFRQTIITVIPLSPPARPGFEASYKIVWENVGNQIESGTLNFTYDETLLDYISATQTADQVADGIIKWNFNNLLPFEKREITVTIKVNRPTDTPAVNAGDKLYLTASILDNIFTLENTVVGSYDPNDKTCLQGDRVKPDMVGEYVDYLIRFENTGNYAAENVVVKDIIDTQTFDVSTLKITDASHEVYTRIEGNKVEFIFENIQLPFEDANNDGYIAFKIKTLPSLVLGDSLINLADIYFDYNFPIRTNEAQTTVALPVFTKDITTEVNIYPNPVTDILYLDTNDHWSKAEIFDIAGRIMRSVLLNSSSMDVSGLESGTYFIRLKDGEKVRHVKFVKI